MTINKSLNEIIDEKDINSFRYFIYELSQPEKKFFLRNEVLQLFEKLSEDKKSGSLFNKGSSIYRFFNKTQEIILLENRAVFLYRREIAKYKIYVIYENSDHLEEISISEYLDLKDNIVVQHNDDPSQKVTIDFLPFYDYAPVINTSKKVGKGIDFLNNYMSSQFIHNPKRLKNILFEFLKIHSLNGQQLLVNGNIIRNERQLNDGLKEVLLWFEESNNRKEMDSVEKKLNQIGFNPGFGNTEERIKETMHLLLELLEEPNSKTLEQFISRIPMVSKIAIISPHGWFCQEDVLGKPDTGGQVIYIMDQVKALEKQLVSELKSSGLANITPKIIVVTRLIPDNENTTCDQRLEKIFNTNNCWVLRVPFKDKDSNIINHWISRFKLWPYLERFVLDVKKELISELGGKPDLIIGNYSDGNLVASFLSQQLHVIQCNIAHALEKPKYLFSALYWQDLEPEYNFSLQFTADLISMNMANFIITSTLQEIIGTNTSIGQYESYQFFTMPKLYKVISGINLFHPKFNVIPPGIDENIYFPYSKTEKRVKNQTENLINLLLYEESDEIYCHLKDPKKRPIFTMSRLDKIKNITGLVEAFGRDKDLQDISNLIVITGNVNKEHTNDSEEFSQIEKMYELIEQYKLDGKIRWLGKYLPKHDTGEIYRIIADLRGVFVQPALFEAFGLTILEAMASGLPVFTTKFGGPIEIIEDNKCGFLIDTTKPDLISKPIFAFLKDIEKNPDHWKEISRNAIKRVEGHYNWKLYAANLLKLTKLYGFWKYSTSTKGKIKMMKYCELLFHLIYKKQAEMLEDGL